MEKTDRKSLIIGVGNSGRGDDGLGWAFLDKVKPLLENRFDIEYRYQLQIEDSELISHYNEVYFVDASKEHLPDGYAIRICEPKETHNFSTHSLSPETVLFLSQSVYNKKPISYILGICGEMFELKIGLSKNAEANLNRAVTRFLQERIIHLN